MNKQAPVYLNLFKIKLPLPGLVSFIHRITGILLFFAIPLSIYLLQLSLQGESGFQHASALLNQPLMIILQVFIVAALFYHLFAGVRFLLMDVDIGYDKRQAELSSWLVIAATLLCTLLFIVIRL